MSAAFFSITTLTNGESKDPTSPCLPPQISVLFIVAVADNPWADTSRGLRDTSNVTPRVGVFQHASAPVPVADSVPGVPLPEETAEEEELPQGFLCPLTLEVGWRALNYSVRVHWRLDLDRKRESSAIYTRLVLFGSCNA